MSLRSGHFEYTLAVYMHEGCAVILRARSSLFLSVCFFVLFTVWVTWVLKLRSFVRWKLGYFYDCVFLYLAESWKWEYLERSCDYKGWLIDIVSMGSNYLGPSLKAILSFTVYDWASLWPLAKSIRTYKDPCCHQPKAKNAGRERLKSITEMSLLCCVASNLTFHQRIWSVLIYSFLCSVTIKLHGAVIMLEHGIWGTRIYVPRPWWLTFGSTLLLTIYIRESSQYVKSKYCTQWFYLSPLFKEGLAM